MAQSSGQPFHPKFCLGKREERAPHLSPYLEGQGRSLIQVSGGSGSRAWDIIPSSPSLFPLGQTPCLLQSVQTGKGLEWEEADHDGLLCSSAPALEQEGNVVTAQPAWWPTPTTPALGKQRQEDGQEFVANLDYTVRSYLTTRTDSGRVRPSYKN